MYMDKKYKGYNKLESYTIQATQKYLCMHTADNSLTKKCFFSTLVRCNTLCQTNQIQSLQSCLTPHITLQWDRETNHCSKLADIVVCQTPQI